MHHRNWVIAVFVLGIAFHPSAPAQSPGASTGRTPADRGVTLADFAWLVGYWRGEGLGGTCEEIWSPALGGTMMGSFRLVKDGKVSFYEIMVLGQDDRGWSLRVKHFSESFVAWEEKPDCVRFALKSVGENEAEFQGLRFERRDDDLSIALRMRARDGKVNWQPFSLKRFALGAATLSPRDNGRTISVIVNRPNDSVLVDGNPMTFSMLNGYLKLHGRMNPKFRDASNPRLASARVVIRCASDQTFDYVKAILQLCASPDIAIHRIAMGREKGSIVETPLPTELDHDLEDVEEPEPEVATPARRNSATKGAAQVRRRIEVRLKQKADDPRPIRERITEYFIGDRPVGSDAAAALRAIRDELARTPRPEVVVFETGFGVPHGRVMQVLESVRSLSVGLVVFKGLVPALDVSRTDLFSRIRRRLETDEHRETR